MVQFCYQVQSKLRSQFLGPLCLWQCLKSFTGSSVHWTRLLSKTSYCSFLAENDSEHLQTNEVAKIIWIKIYFYIYSKYICRQTRWRPITMRASNRPWPASTRSTDDTSASNVEKKCSNNKLLHSVQCTAAHAIIIKGKWKVSTISIQILSVWAEDHMGCLRWIWLCFTRNKKQIKISRSQGDLSMKYIVRYAH